MFNSTARKLHSSVQNSYMYVWDLHNCRCWWKGTYATHLSQWPEFTAHHLAGEDWTGCLSIKTITQPPPDTNYCVCPWGLGGKKHIITPKDSSPPRSDWHPWSGDDYHSHTISPLGCKVHQQMIPSQLDDAPLWHIAQLQFPLLPAMEWMSWHLLLCTDSWITQQCNLELNHLEQWLIDCQTSPSSPPVCLLAGLQQTSQPGAFSFYARNAGCSAAATEQDTIAGWHNTWMVCLSHNLRSRCNNNLTDRGLLHVICTIIGQLLCTQLLSSTHTMLEPLEPGGTHTRLL